MGPIWNIPELLVHIPFLSEETSDLPLPSMHPIWNIPELLAHILSFLDEKSDILRCALVCRSLSVEAARLIWKEVSAFRYLLGCFPNNTIATEMSGPPDDPSRTFLFLELPDTAEWNHMRFRASMVRELTFPRRENYDPLLEVIKRQLTFPELISLHLHVSVAKRFQTILPLFAASRLQELEITFEEFNDRLINTTMETLLAQAHPLQSLNIAAGTFPKLSQHYMIQLLESTPSINSLSFNLDVIDEKDIIQAAARLPNLRYFSFGLEGFDPAQYSPGFQSLVALDISSTYRSTLAVACAITSSSISVLNIHVWTRTTGPPRSLFAAIATMASLNSVVIIFYKSAIQWEDVKPLLGCPLISTFEIDMDSPGMEIDDEDISAISRAWPNLVRLRLDGFHDTPDLFARPSLHGLAELLGRCPKLQELSLEVDAARQLPAALANATPTSAKPHEKLLFSVRRSPIAQNSEETISEYLMSLWPGECKVASWWEEEEWQQATWKKVGELTQQRG